MMKIFILLFLLTATVPYPRQPDLYDVTKIKVVGNYFVIYVRNDGNTYKIVSMKEPNQHCVKIRKRKRYPFALTEIDALGGPEIDCFSFDEKTVICKEPDVQLVFAKNLKGLCFVD